MSFDYNTKGSFVVQDYLRYAFSLDKDKFASLFTETAEMTHTSNGTTSEVKGRDKIMDIYTKNFFEVTSNISVVDINIKADALTPQFRCVVQEERKTTYGQRKIEIKDTTTLHLVEEDKVLKIAKIISDVVIKTIEEK